MIHDCLQGVPYAARQRCDHDGRQLEAPISPHGHHLEGAPRLEAFVAEAQKMQDEGQQLEQAQESHHRQVQCHERIKIRAHQVQGYLQPRQEFLQPVDGAPCLEQRHRYRPKCHAEEQSHLDEKPPHQALAQGFRCVGPDDVPGLWRLLSDKRRSHDRVLVQHHLTRQACSLQTLEGYEGCRGVRCLPPEQNCSTSRIHRSCAEARSLPVLEQRRSCSSRRSRGAQC
mmetsp:Transcript_100072/g.254456  ORF Transcript_100072/g.254456 Transcript_100072/m.254456 type:complete len:227 (+) Transcript_100072:947-1627(+)